ncbi:MAG TPA: hypothetical protein VGR81_06355 [Candidatus Acidoferrales bacterium]|nr:hypothetical protein [Candidatus Acidoferrales bacterium]
MSARPRPTRNCRKIRVLRLLADGVERTAAQIGAALRLFDYESVMHSLAAYAKWSLVRARAGWTENRWQRYRTRYWRITRKGRGRLAWLEKYMR